MNHQQFKIIHSKSNTLLTLKGKQLPDGSPQVLLMGLIESKQTEDSTVGWILVISGNPLIPRDKGDVFSNKIGLDKLHITWDQKQAILETSIYPDGYVYLYGGQFSVNRCQKSRKCDQHNSNLLNILGEKLNEYKVKIDLIRVVPFLAELLKRIIIPCTNPFQTESFVEKRTSIPDEDDENKENFIFRGNELQSYVELECPLNHPDYLIELYMLERYVYKCKGMDSCRPMRHTRVIEQDVISVPSENYLNAPLSRFKRVHIKVFQLPTNFVDLEIIKKFVLKRVEYWGVARILKNDNWKDMTLAKLLERKLTKRSRDMLKTVASGGIHIYQNLMCDSFKTSNSYKKLPKTCVSSECPSYKNCSISANIVIMELNLVY